MKTICAMVPHSEDSRCVCTDGLEAHRDVMDYCNAPVKCECEVTP